MRVTTITGLVILLSEVIAIAMLVKAPPPVVIGFSVICAATVVGVGIYAYRHQKRIRISRSTRRYLMAAHRAKSAAEKQRVRLEMLKTERELMANAMEERDKSVEEQYMLEQECRTLELKILCPPDSDIAEDDHHRARQTSSS